MNKQMMKIDCEDFLKRRFVVSDITSFTCGSGPSSVVSDDCKSIYSAFLTSRTGKGECHDIVAISDIPLDAPASARSYVIGEKGENIAGVQVDDIILTTSFKWNGMVRVILSLNDAFLGWRDWNPITKSIAGEGIFKCRFNGNVQKLTPEALMEYLSLIGCKGFDVFKELHDRVLASSRMCHANGSLYGFMTSSNSQPILYRCDDGECFDFISIVPNICQYECQVEYMNGIFYAIGRGMVGDNFWVSKDNGKTFTPAGRVPDGLCRQQLLVHADQLLIGYPAPDEKPSIVRNGRNNFHLLAGNGTQIDDFREIFHALDPMGLIMFEFVPVKDEIYVIWSNAERFPDYVKWGAVQGKDQLLMSKLM